MKKITLVTGNKSKLNEWRSMLPDHIKIESADIDLPEIQSLDFEEIAENKVKKAFDIVGSPVIIEDVSAGLDDLAGLPGPFYKFFHKQLGVTVLVRLSAIASNRVTVRCTTAYFDGEKLLFGTGVNHGVVVEPRGENGFGFDPVILVDGEDLTLGEMTPAQKHKISHRSRAINELIKQL